MFMKIGRKREADRFAKMADWERAFADRVLLAVTDYGWRNGAKFTKFIFIQIQCCYCYSRIYLFTFNNRVNVQKIYLFAFNGVFLIHDYRYSHLGDVFIHIQRVIFIHIHDRNMVGEMVQNSQSLYSFSIFCAALLRIIRS